MRRGNRMMEDLDQDIRDHIEMETQDNIERGMAPEEARYVAVRRFGNVTRVKEETREVWSFVWLEQLWQEQALKACGANWTILRCNFFSQNFSENFFLDAIPAGDVALPVGPVAEPFVDAEDIADAAVAVLTLPGPRQSFMSSRARSQMTFADAIGEIARMTGRDIRYRPIAPEDRRATRLQAQIPERDRTGALPVWHGSRRPHHPGSRRRAVHARSCTT
jgi:hypothetical protein